MTEGEFASGYTKSLGKLAWDTNVGIPRVVHPHEQNALCFSKNWGQLALESFSLRDQELSLFDQTVKDIIMKWFESMNFKQDRKIITEHGYLFRDKIVTLKASDGRRIGRVSFVMRYGVAFICVRPFEYKAKEGRGLW